MKKKIWLLLCIATLLFVSGCNLFKDEASTKKTEVVFAENSQENEDPISSIEIDFDSKKLEGWGVGFEGLVNTNSYKILPLNHYFDFEIMRDTDIVSANFTFKSDEKETLSFVVNLEDNKVVEKNITSKELNLDQITDEEITDIAYSIKRMYKPLTGWE